MLYTSKILDRNDAEWTLSCTLSGVGLYDDDMNHAGFVVQDFNITDITLTLDGVTIKCDSLALMPDIFLQEQLTWLEQDAEQFFLMDWQAQDFAH